MTGVFPLCTIHLTFVSQVPHEGAYTHISYICKLNSIFRIIVTNNTNTMKILASDAVFLFPNFIFVQPNFEYLPN